MSYADDPKLTLDAAEWRAYKRACRALQHKQRLERAPEVDPMAWLAAVERDDMTDLYNNVQEVAEVPNV